MTLSRLSVVLPPSEVQDGAGVKGLAGDNRS